MDYYDAWLTADDEDPFDEYYHQDEVKKYLEGEDYIKEMFINYYEKKDLLKFDEAFKKVIELYDIKPSKANPQKTQNLKKI